MAKFSEQDRIFMQRALALAAKAAGKTAPNPMVGAVLVHEGKIIAEGYHHGFGKPHAEVEALKKIPSVRLKHCVLYVSLEPCSHHGKTPPCADFLVQKEVSRVIVAAEDPNPLVQGKGIAKLKAAGVKVQIGLLAQKAEKLNEAFYYAMREKSAFVTVKMAVTLDGKIATESGDSRWISNEQSRTEVHRLRSYTQAILTTAQTVLSDDPHLGVRMVKGRDPLRIVLDRKLVSPIEAKIYRNPHVLVVTTQAGSLKRRKLFEKAAIPLLVYPGSRISLKQVLKDLFVKNIHSVMVEAGSGLFTSLLKEKLVNKMIIFVAPKILGKGISLVGDLKNNRMNNALELQEITVRQFGDNMMVIGYPFYR